MIRVQIPQGLGFCLAQSYVGYAIVAVDFFKFLNDLIDVKS